MKKLIALSTISFALPIACGGPLEGGEETATTDESLTFDGQYYLDFCKSQAPNDVIDMGPNNAEETSIGSGAYNSGFCKSWLVEVNIPPDSDNGAYEPQVHFDLDAPIRDSLNASACDDLYLQATFYQNGTKIGFVRYRGSYVAEGLLSGCHLGVVIGSELPPQNPPSWTTKTIRVSASAWLGTLQLPIELRTHHLPYIY